ncbi:hypothetical protein PS726_04720 [Pseudomonas fluorescens]|nr:hypothetical protein PS647_01363 [Pseudomonas fluorescens]VVO27612.1 hypothetical protein PS726_04720 [Pseudomonas fluorescens]VVO54712.1 hypothetical protein PS843_00466 [Pseudomonas fluorescens]
MVSLPCDANELARLGRDLIGLCWYVSDRNGSRLCENTLDAFKTEFCLCNQQAEARIAPSSNISPRNAVWAASAAQTATNGRASGWIYALIASSSPAMPKMLIIRLRL